MKEVKKNLLKQVSKMLLVSAKQSRNTACSGPLFEPQRPEKLKK